MRSQPTPHSRARLQDLNNVTNSIKHFPYKVVSKSEKPVVKVDVKGVEKTFSPEEISGMILGKMKEVAEGYLGKK